MEKRKFDKVLDAIRAFDLSANGEKMLFRQGDSWFIASTTQPIKPGEGKIKTEDMEVYVDPKAEWQQMYQEAGASSATSSTTRTTTVSTWSTAKKYEPYLAALTHRADLSYLFQKCSAS